MSRLFFSGRRKAWSAAIIVVAVAGAALLGIFTISPPLASTQDEGRVCTLQQDGPARPPTGGELGKLLIWKEPCALPEISWQDGDGGTLTLADFQGKLLVVNLWATWCAPCIKEMPALSRLQAAMGGPDFQVLAINQDRDGAKIAGEWLEKAGIDNLGVHVNASGTVGRALKTPGLPVTVVIDEQGREIGRLMGESEWDSPVMQEMLRGLMLSEPA